MIKGMEEKGIDHEALLNTYIQTYNKILEGRPEDMTVGLHLCRGNFKVSFADVVVFENNLSKYYCAKGRNAF